MTAYNIKHVISPAAQQVMRLLGGSNAIRLVGGCVRNALLDLPVTDHDMATVYTPDEGVEILSAHGIKTVPTGIEHGTITAVIEGENIEITTLRIDSNEDGRHADVTFTNNWLDDARRRDFTMNTLLADGEGNIYDPLGCGLDDLQARRVRFVGNPPERIREDALRILRFFRFYAYYGAGEADQGALKACADLSDMVDGLSRERITQEFLKILAAPNAAAILRLMRGCQILNPLMPLTHWDDLEKVVARQINQGAEDVMARLYTLGAKEEALDRWLALSNKQKQRLTAFAKVKEMTLQDSQEIKEAMYHHGRDAALQVYLMQAAQVQPTDIDMMQTWDIPRFPLTGADLMKEGFTQGKALGQELKAREAQWIKNGFQ
tara:strand:- start:59235 stop:60365 length:1131 start_codon:yes stop_codon:yes gene_type:complete